MQTEGQTVESQTQTITARVRNLMLRNSIGKREQSNALSRILGLSYSQAHRKLNEGEDDEWKIGELRAIAEEYKVPLASLLSSEEEKQELLDAKPEYEPEEAIFELAGRRFPCVIQVGEVIDSWRNLNFVAMKTRDAWIVYEGAEAPEGEAKYRVEKLEMSITHPHSLAVAVVDDDKIAAETLKDYLAEVGFNAFAYFNATDMAASLETKEYDAYVVDWLLGRTTAEALIRAIREKSPAAPIFLLTGALANDNQVEPELARVVRYFNVVFQPKPIRPLILSAEISKTLGVA